MRLSRKSLIVGGVVMTFTAAASLYGFQVVEGALIRDARFAVARPDAAPADFLRVSGLTHTSIQAVENVFAGDFGRSLYLVPLEERLEALRQVDWVRDAAIARVWPNHLLVHISEREPVAFVTLSRSRFALIDEEGVILPPVPDQYNLPVLAGVRSGDDPGQRREAVQRFLRISRDLGPEAMEDVSEVDVSQPGNIAVTRPYDGRVLRLFLGDRNYGARYQNFVDHFAQVDVQIPGAKTVDLRLEDRITVVEVE